MDSAVSCHRSCVNLSTSAELLVHVGIPPRPLDGILPPRGDFFRAWGDIQVAIDPTLRETETVACDRLTTDLSNRRFGSLIYADSASRFWTPISLPRRFPYFSWCAVTIFFIDLHINRCSGVWLASCFDTQSPRSPSTNDRQGTSCPVTSYSGIKKLHMQG